VATAEWGMFSALGNNEALMSIVCAHPVLGHVTRKSLYERGVGIGRASIQTHTEIGRQ
jgi:hypothetical protein